MEGGKVEAGKDGEKEEGREGGRMEGRRERGWREGRGMEEGWKRDRRGTEEGQKRDGIILRASLTFLVPSNWQSDEVLDLHCR